MREQLVTWSLRLGFALVVVLSIYLIAFRG